MGQGADKSAAKSVPPIVTELRALEWELSDAIRRLETLRDQVRRLQISESEDASEDTEPGAL